MLTAVNATMHKNGQAPLAFLLIAAKDAQMPPVGSTGKVLKRTVREIYSGVLTEKIKESEYVESEYAAYADMIS